MLAKSLEALIKKLTFIKAERLPYTNHFKKNLIHGYFSKTSRHFQNNYFPEHEK